MLVVILVQFQMCLIHLAANSILFSAQSKSGERSKLGVKGFVSAPFSCRTLKVTAVNTASHKTPQTTEPICQALKLLSPQRVL